MQRLPTVLLAVLVAGSGRAVAQPDAAAGEGCGSADFDGDNDVDQLDFGLLQRCYSGVGRLPEPQCDL